MDSLFGKRESFGGPAAMAERVVADAKRAYSDTVDAGILERAAREAVADLWTDSIKVTSFIPVLALRRVRETLEERTHREERTVAGT